MQKSMTNSILKPAIILTLTLLLTLCCLAAPALAYDESAYWVWIDQKAVPRPPASQHYNSGSAARLFINGIEQLDPNIYLAPVIDNTAYVPLRLVSEQLEAQVSYGKGLIIISRGDTELKLQLNSAIAYKSDSQQTDQPISLVTPPFVCDNSTYVPLRFIAEAFGCQVAYNNGQIHITTSNNISGDALAAAPAAEALSINGQQITKLIYIDESHTMGADVYEITDQTLLKQVYQRLQGCLGDTAAPPTYVTSPSVVLPGDFTRLHSFFFLNAQGQTLCDISSFKQYQSQAPGNPMGAEQLRPYPYVLTDNLSQTSYSCTEAAYAVLLPSLQSCAAQGVKTQSAA